MKRLFLISVLSGCVSPSVEIGFPCPCGSGYVCCQQINECIPEGQTCPAPLPQPGCYQSTKGRYDATATYLPENGGVLLIGGGELKQSSFEYPKSVERLDPPSGSIGVVAELRSGGARARHTATRMEDGRVLVAGGESHVQFTREALRSAFLVDARNPTKANIVEGGLAMRQARTAHAAVLLADGRVMFVGGRVINAGATSMQDHTYLSSIEIYDPKTGVFTLPTTMSGTAVELSTPRSDHSATLLNSGQVLVAGGMNSTRGVNTLEIIEVEGDRVSVQQVSELLSVGPIQHTATLLENGFVLLAGGFHYPHDAYPAGAPPRAPSDAVESWEYMPVARESHKRCTATLNTARGAHGAHSIGKSVFFIGGHGVDGATLDSFEVATISIGSKCFAAPPRTDTMCESRASFASVQVGSSQYIAILGGRQATNQQITATTNGVEVLLISE